uniref:Putative HNH nuclease YajD n=1 Tax=Candidatus Kentrum sp. FM TaxID=2126340 RepID=A0A450SJ92_9GAMM|nr:MAG: HNH endonuclease [Candidatus Kentron sp. FM]VFJ53850.1 MAG: HNH endonuclease [Candidatus Kentron sp. FM]VFK11523.1 MAG: HNH endonuclease [Candidatus Kentron sp. FM]
MELKNKTKKPVVKKKRPSIGSGGQSTHKLDEIVARARRERDERDSGYREQSLRIHPWVCARCGREFTRENLQELTVHHKDHNHDNNPPDGSNWENLCIYCHENEHARHIDHVAADGTGALAGGKESAATHNPFEGLKGLLK